MFDLETYAVCYFSGIQKLWLLAQWKTYRSGTPSCSGRLYFIVCGLVGNLQLTDDRIEKVKCDRRQVIEKILNIPSNECDVIHEV